MVNQSRFWNALFAGILLSSPDSTTSLKRRRNSGYSGSNNLAEAYVTAPGAVPLDRQIRWLRQMTTDICQSQVGHLSKKQLSQTRDLMFELAHNQKLISSYCDTSSEDECAVTIESLLRRVVAEQKNVAAQQQQRQSLQQYPPKEIRAIVSPDSTNVEVTVDDYNCVLEGWARSPSASFRTAERCEQILGAMIRYGPYPNRESFKACFKAWKQAMSNDKNKIGTQQEDISSVAPRRAQRLLELMIRSYDPSSPARSTVLPDAECFDSVLKMWSRSNSPDAPHEAELIVAVMDKMHRTLHVADLRPKRNTLHYVMTSWVNLRRSTSTEINSDVSRAPIRVASILDFMNKRASQLGEADISPDAISYNIVFNSFIHQSDPEQLLWAANKAHSYVSKIVSDYKSKMSQQGFETEISEISKDNVCIPAVVPDTILFNTAMGIWGKVKGAHAANKVSTKGRVPSYQMARQILDQQIDLYENHACISCKPDVFGFTSVIGCCSAVNNPIEQRRAFRVALQTFNQLRDMSQNDELRENSVGTTQLQPNHITYGAILKACARLLPMDSIERQCVVQDVFNECRDKGHVSDLVLSWLRDATTSMDEYNELTQGYTRKTLPQSWSVNVQMKKQHVNKKSDSSQQKTFNSKRHTLRP